MTVFLQDSFTDVNGTLLESHFGEIGATWVKSAGSGSWDIQSNRTRAITGASYLSSGVPPSADYTVEGVIRYMGGGPTIGQAAIVGRGSGGTYYMVWARNAQSKFDLTKSIAGVQTNLGTFPQTFASGTDYAVKLVMAGTAISAIVNDVEIITATDSAISAAGVAGVYSGGGNGATTDLHVAEISAYDVPGAAEEWSAATVKIRQAT